MSAIRDALHRALNNDHSRLVAIYDTAERRALQHRRNALADIERIQDPQTGRIALVEWDHPERYIESDTVELIQE